MTTKGHGCCSRCGARLRRRGGPGGQGWCDPCRRAGPDPRRDLPAGFYRQDWVVAALADYDFGTFFRDARAATGWSQHTLGQLVGLDQNRVSAIERDVRGLRDVAKVAQVATGLCIPPALLGFGGSPTIVEATGATPPKWVSWVDRRDFVQQVAALALGVGGAASVDIDRLTALLPHADPTGTRLVGTADVEVIEQATAAFASQDWATGSGPVRDVAVGQLRSVLPLLGAQMSAEIRSRLYLAASRLATQAGWMSFQVNHDDAARRLWMIALDIARDTDHPLAGDQRVFVLYDLALQAVALGRPEEALRLTHLGHSAAVGPYAVSAATLSCLTNAQARAHAAQGDSTACDRTLGQATEHFTRIDPTRDWWTDFLDESMLASLQGVAHYELALAARDSHSAGQAVSLLHQAVDGFGPTFAVPQAKSLANLAGAHAIAGDTDTAVSVGHQAVDAVTALSSPRAHDRLRVLDTTLQPLHTSPGVAELRHRLTDTDAT